MRNMDVVKCERQKIDRYRPIAFALALMIAVTLSSCGNEKSANKLNTDALKKFVQNSKKKGNMSYDKTKKAYKSIFPKMKMK